MNLRIRTTKTLFWILLVTGLCVPKVVVASEAYAVNLERATESKCSVPLAENAPGNWSGQEKWAWDHRICVGLVADLSKRIEKTNGYCNVKNTTDWPDNQLIRSKFVQTVLFHKPFRDVFAQRGFKMRCAKFDKILDLSSGNFPHEIWIHDTIFFDGINASYLTVDHNFSLTGSQVRGTFDGTGMRVGGSLFLRNGATFQDVHLLSADIFLNLVASNSTFKGFIHAGNLRVGKGVYLNEGSTFDKHVHLVATSIGGDFDVSKAQFGGSLTLSRTSIGGALLISDAFFLRHPVKFREECTPFSCYSVEEQLRLFCIPHRETNENSNSTQVLISNTRVSGDFFVNDSCFQVPLNAYGMKVDGNIQIVGTNQISSMFETVNLSGTKIGGRLRVTGYWFGDSLIAGHMRVGHDVLLGHNSDLKSVDFSGTNIASDLKIGPGTFRGEVSFENATVVGSVQFGSESKYGHPKWKATSKLLLRNFTVGNVKFHSEALTNLDDRVDLVGFRYREFQLYDATTGVSTSDLPIEWLRSSWFGKQQTRDSLFQPQPYRQLAIAHRDAGYDDKATQILTEMHNHRLFHRMTPLFDKILLLAKFLLIEYGYSVWWAVIWFLLIVFIGMIVARCSSQSKNINYCYCLFFSLECAIPLIELTPLNQQFAKKLSPHVDRYFQVQKILGLVVVSVLVAGITGLIK